MPIVGSLDVWLDAGDEDSPQQLARQRNQQSPFTSKHASDDLRTSPSGEPGLPTLGATHSSGRQLTLPQVLGRVNVVRPPGLRSATHSAQQAVSPPRRQQSLLSRQLSQSITAVDVGQSMGRDVVAPPGPQPAASNATPGSAAGASRQRADAVPHSSTGSGQLSVADIATATATSSAASPATAAAPSAASFISGAQPRTPAEAAATAISIQPDAWLGTRDVEKEMELQEAAARAWAAHAAAIAPLTAAVRSSDLIAAAAGYAGSSASGSSSSGTAAGDSSLPGDDSISDTRRGSGGGGAVAFFVSGSAPSSEGDGACSVLAAAALAGSDDGKGHGSHTASRDATAAPAGGIPCGRAPQDRGRWDAGRGGSAGRLSEGGGRREGPSRSGVRGGRAAGYSESLPEQSQRQGPSSAGSLAGPLSASPRAPNSGSLSRTYGPSAAPAGAGARLIAAAASAATAVTLSLPGVLGVGLSPAGPEESGERPLGMAALASPLAPVALPPQPLALSHEQRTLQPYDSPAGGPSGQGVCAGSAAAAAAGTTSSIAGTATSYTTSASAAAVAVPGTVAPALPPTAAADAAAGAAASPPCLLSWPFAAGASAFAAAMAAADGAASPAGGSDSGRDGGSDGSVGGEGRIGSSSDGATQMPVPSVSSYPPSGPSGAAMFEGTMRGGLRRGTSHLMRLESAPARSLLMRMSQGGGMPDGA